MSEFQRFVTYINLYQGNSKIKNVGFARIEKRGEQCKIEIHMRGTGYSGVACPIYLFVRKENMLPGLSIGKIQMNNGNGDGGFLLEEETLRQKGYQWKEISGFFIFVTEQVMFASQWDEGQLRREQFVPIQEAKPQREAAASIKEAPSLKAAEAMPQRQEAPSVKTANPAQATPTKSENPQEVPWPEKWQFILENYPVLTPFQEEEEIQCVRIELKDLRLLPKRYWYLGNNSFLLHGFFNYRYLIIGVMEHQGEQRWFLGIPGIFQSQEKVMASIFGFTEYKSEKKTPQKTGEFGYWYRFLEEAIKL